jgi:ribose 5-phosphate isomerase A
MAQSLVARKLISMGGQPELRTGFTSDNGNVILDVCGLDLTDPLRMEAEINLLAGVVDNGLFAVRRADVLLVGTDDGVDQLQV